MNTSEVLRQIKDDELRLLVQRCTNKNVRRQNRSKILLLSSNRSKNSRKRINRLQAENRELERQYDDMTERLGEMKKEYYEMVLTFLGVQSAIVSERHDGMLDVYYGGIDKIDGACHGHLILGTDGQILYLRRPDQARSNPEINLLPPSQQQGRKVPKRFSTIIRKENPPLQ